MKKNLFIVLLVLSMTMQGQISQGGSPRFFYEQIASKSFGSKTVVLPKLDYTKIQKEDKEDETNENIAMRFAYGHEVQLNLNNSGQLYTASNGDRFWILNIVSEGAKSLSFTFSNFYLPEGTELFVYNKDRSDIKGAFTHKNNNKSGFFSIAPVRGDQVTFNLYIPKQVKEKPIFKLETIAHDYSDIFKIAKAMAKSENRQKMADENPCFIGANCDSDIGGSLKREKQSVVMILTSSGERICTGALINNSNVDATPYLLTAEHCKRHFSQKVLPGQTLTPRQIRDSERDDPRKWMVVFNYEGDCQIDEGSTDQSISGTKIIYDPWPFHGIVKVDKDFGFKDFLLLELSKTPPLAYDPYYSGWDATSEKPRKISIIHHPFGSPKKVSQSSPAKLPSFDNERNVQKVIWSRGITAEGSSGAPLYNERREIIGVFHGGFSECDSRDSEDSYYPFKDIYPFIKEFIAPSGITSIRGSDPLPILPKNLISDNNVNIKLSPNPVKDILVITHNFQNKDKINVNILDGNGRMMSNKTYFQNTDNNKLHIDVSNLNRGMYFCKVKNKNSEFVKKFIISI